ncbi:hypothetical protein EV175_006507, partial [Coemansia sp. RSA 1933]
DHSRYIRSHQSLFYGHAEDVNDDVEDDDDDEDVVDEDRVGRGASSSYNDDDDEDDGPAERIGRYNSYQNEPAPFGEDEDVFSEQDCTNFLANLTISTNGTSSSPSDLLKKKQQPPPATADSAIPFNVLTSPLDAPKYYPFGADPESKSSTAVAIEPGKGRIKDLFHESKQRSRSSSELDSIVPADIASWDPPSSSSSSTGPDKADKPNGRSQQLVNEDDTSFNTRRRRSRSQSAGVGVSRAMVIQAAIQGQFPYLDAKTCEFVGQLKSDTVTLGGAAAGPNREGSSSSSSGGSGAARQRSKTVNSSGNNSNNNNSACARFQP